KGACAAPRVTHVIEERRAGVLRLARPRLLPLDREILQQVDRVAVALRRRHYLRIAQGHEESLVDDGAVAGRDRGVESDHVHVDMWLFPVRHDAPQVLGLLEPVDAEMQRAGSVRSGGVDVEAWGLGIVTAAEFF